MSNEANENPVTDNRWTPLAEVVCQTKVGQRRFERALLRLRAAMGATKPVEYYTAKLGPGGTQVRAGRRVHSWTEASGKWLLEVEQGRSTLFVAPGTNFQVGWRNWRDFTLTLGVSQEWSEDLGGSRGEAP